MERDEVLLLLHSLADQAKDYGLLNAVNGRLARLNIDPDIYDQRLRATGPPVPPPSAVRLALQVEHDGTVHHRLEYQWPDQGGRWEPWPDNALQHTWRSIPFAGVHMEQA